MAKSIAKLFSPASEIVVPHILDHHFQLANQSSYFKQMLANVSGAFIPGPIEFKTGFLFNENGILDKEKLRASGLSLPKIFKETKDALEVGGHVKSAEALQRLTENPDTATVGILIRSLHSYSAKSHADVLGLPEATSAAFCRDGRVNTSHYTCQSPYYVQGFLLKHAIPAGLPLTMPLEAMVAFIATDSANVLANKISFHSQENKETPAVAIEGSMSFIDKEGRRSIALLKSPVFNQDVLLRQSILEHEAKTFLQLVKDVKIDFSADKDPEAYLKEFRNKLNVLIDAECKKVDKAYGKGKRFRPGYLDNEEVFVKEFADYLQKLYANYQICMVRGAKPEDFNKETQELMKYIRLYYDNLSLLSLGPSSLAATAELGAGEDIQPILQVVSASQPHMAPPLSEVRVRPEIGQKKGPTPS